MKTNNQAVIGDEFVIPLSREYQDLFFTIIEINPWSDHFVYDAICIEDESIQISIHSTDIELIQ